MANVIRWELEIGECYFRLCYDDDDHTILHADAYFFLGKNILSSVSDDLWFFQEAEHFMKHGFPADFEDIENSGILAVPQEALLELTDWSGFADEIARNKSLKNKEQYLSVQRALYANATEHGALHRKM